MTDRPIPRIALTREEAAAALGMSLSHFKRHVQPYVRCVHTGARTSFLVKDLEVWMEREATLGGRAA